MTENTASLKVEQLKAAGYRYVPVVDGGVAQVLAKPISEKTIRMMEIVAHQPTRGTRRRKPRSGKVLHAR